MRGTAGRFSGGATWLLGFALATSVVAARVSAQGQVEVGTPVPSWVEPVELPASIESFEGHIEQLLHDEQWNVEANRSVEFERSAYRVRALSGVQRASELSINVESDEQLDLHYVRRHRDGVPADVLRADMLRVIQPETRLGSGTYDESRRALVFLEDVRVGDVIEFAFSTTRTDAIRRGRFATRFALGYGNQVRRMRVSMRWPRGRRIRARVHPLSFDLDVREAEGSITVDGRDVPAVERPRGLPSWHRTSPWMEATEFESWPEVVEWGLTLYPAMNASEVDTAPMDRFRSGATPEERMLAALRFVQDEVRYLGIQVREHAYVPHAPRLVLERRYGDCKDKAFLLLTILRALGIEAHIAFVHTVLGREVAALLPSSASFNHDVVRATIAGRHYWLDATSSHERGGVTELPSLDVARALLVRDGETGLSEVPVRLPEEPELDVVETFDTDSLEVVMIFRGSRANRRRARGETTSREEMQEQDLEFYRKRELDVSVRAPMEVEDDEASNVIVVREHYTLAGADGELDLGQWGVDDQIVLPDTRDAPFALEYPLHVRHRVVAQSRQTWEPASGEASVDGPGFEFEHSVVNRGHELELASTIRTTGDHVPTERLASYVQEAERAIELASFVADPVQVVDEPPRDGFSFFGTLACCAIAGFAGVVAFGSTRIPRWRKSRRQRAFEKLQKFDLGASPGSAIEVRDEPEARERIERRKCCDAQVPEGTWTEIRFGGRPVLLYADECPVCRNRIRRYFKPAVDDGG